MSKKEKTTVETTEKKETSEKVVTKYDRKMEAYKKQEAKEKKEKLITDVICAVIVLAVVAFIASFPIRTMLAVNESYVDINGEKVTKVEYEYQYTLAKNDYLNQYGSYFSMFGMTDLSDIENQVYSDTLTFGDYFGQLAVESITQNRALLREAKAAGFSYDPTEEYNETLQMYKDEASKAGMTLNKYLKTLFGEYATEARLKPLQQNALIAAAYYDAVRSSKEPDSNAIESYYQEHKEDYDVVDYYLETVEAQLPTTLPDGSLPVDEEGNEIPYEPTEKEIEDAMKEAKLEADQLQSSSSFGELKEAESSAYLSALLRDYLFDDSRKANDKAVLEDNNNHRYQVVQFVKRYRQETPTVDMYAIVVDGEDAGSILDTWKNGEATQESFAQLAKNYALAAGSTGEGLFEGIDPTSLEDDMAAWLQSGDRKQGDYAAFQDSENYGYVFYYMGKNDPMYSLSIQSSMTGDAMTEYMNSIVEGTVVDDPKNHLVYLHVSEEADTMD